MAAGACLERASYRHRADGLLLSRRRRQRRRQAAAPGMRAAVACAAACLPAAGRVDSAGRHVRPASLPPQSASAAASRDGAPLPLLWVHFPSAAAPHLAPTPLAETSPPLPT